MREAGRRIRHAVATAPPLAVLALGWLVLVVYAFPGQLTQDSYDHLREVRERTWTDAHPPLMNLLWRIADYVVAGPFAMLVLQVTLFLTGLYLVFRRTFAPRPAAWAATGLALFPPVMPPFAVICKDAPMTGALLIGAALLHAERRWVRIAGLGALGVATGLRYNALAATFPLIVLVFEWRPGARWLRRYTIGVAAWLATTVVAFAFNAAVTDKPMYGWYSTLAVYDIVGTLAFVDEDLPDAELERIFAGTELRVHHDIHGAIRRVYRPDEYLPIIMEYTHPFLWQLPINGYVPAPEPQREAIGRAYREVIAGHLGAYLQHRLAVMSEVLWIGHARPVGVIRTRTIPMLEYHSSLGIGTAWSRLQIQMTRWLRFVWKQVPIFLPWTYVIASLLLLPLAWRHRDMLALLLSGLCLELSLLPLAASPDYRYSHWMILCVWIAVIVLTSRRRRAAVDRRGMLPASTIR